MNFLAERATLMQRTILGLLAITLLCAAGLIVLLAPDASSWQASAGMMMRLGIMFGVLWMAIPNFHTLFARVPPWLLAFTFAAAFIVLRWPRTIFAIGPLTAALWVIGPNWLGKRK